MTKDHKCTMYKMGVEAMRQIFVSDTDKTMYEMLYKSLQDYYRIEALLQDSEQQGYLIKNEVEAVILPVSERNPESFRIYQKIKNAPRLQGKPIIFLTSKSSVWIENEILAQGVRDFIELPATSAMLYTKIESILEYDKLRNNRNYVDKYQDAISLSLAELVDCRDETTGGHLKNSTRYFHILLREAIAGNYYKDILEREDVNDLLRSAILHDIGKIGINDDVLRKTSPLDYHEYEHMKTHTTLGRQAFEKIIRETGGTRWLYLAKDIAYCHHERWDGSGYPNGLKGEEIPIYARIMAVADVYDALTQVRPYKEAYSHEQAMKIIIEGRGRLFDPRLVDFFVTANEHFKNELLNRNSSYDLLEKE